MWGRHPTSTRDELISLAAPIEVSLGVARPSIAYSGLRDLSNAALSVADTPEGALTLELRSSDGALLARKDLTASSGSGVRGSFSATLRCHATGPPPTKAHTR